ncbi:hydrolase [Methylobacterium sp. E-041]|uniref:hydrolase n=1 Tax=unclassified Methylobacterium TaxID=2615210 RepID=UPI001FB87EB6|nr:hydrolase [Methylobacterium sp. E-041]MCJ2104497.1 hydrolase [Methylobacterium sp. E-041]
MVTRQVFYLPGFDPRQPETYWGLFRRESRLTAARRGLDIAVSDPSRSADRLSLDWTLESGGTRTRYGLLRWDDIVRARFPRPNWRRLLTVPALLWRLRRSGYERRLRREGRSFAMVIFGVQYLFLVFVALSLGLAALPPLALPADWRPWSWLAVPVAAYAILAGIMAITRGKPFYCAHLVDDTAFTHDHAAGREARMPERLDAMAARIAAAEGTADEVVVIGHSSSSFLGVEVLDRILSADPAFGTRGTPVSFVTLGSVIPWIALDRPAVKFRAALARFAAADQIRWLDVRAPWDWLSIHLRDPLTASDVPSPDRGRPATRYVRLEDLIEHRLIRGRRFNLFQMHFQLLMSSLDTDGFDYIALVSGPEPVHAAIDRRCGARPASPSEGGATAVPVRA